MSNYKRKEVFDYLTRKPVTTQDIELAQSRIQPLATRIEQPETDYQTEVQPDMVIPPQDVLPKNSEPVMPSAPGIPDPQFRQIELAEGGRSKFADGTRLSFEEKQKTLKDIKKYVDKKLSKKEIVTLSELNEKFGQGQRREYLYREALGKDYNKITKLQREGVGRVSLEVKDKLYSIIDEVVKGKRPLMDLSRKNLNQELPPVSERQLSKYLNENKQYKDYEIASNVDKVQQRIAKGNEKLKDATLKNIESQLELTTANLRRPSPRRIEEFIVRDLVRHDNQGGELFKVLPSSNTKFYDKIKILDITNDEILTAKRIKDLVDKNDPRFKEYKDTFEEINQLKKTPYVDPVTKEETNLLKALQQATGNKQPLNIDHLENVKDNPLNKLAVSTYKANTGANIKDITEEELSMLGRKKFTPEQNIERLTKFADRRLLQEAASGFEKVKTPLETLASKRPSALFLDPTGVGTFLETSAGQMLSKSAPNLLKATSRLSTITGTPLNALLGVAINAEENKEKGLSDLETIAAGAYKGSTQDLLNFGDLIFRKLPVAIYEKFVEDKPFLESLLNKPEYFEFADKQIDKYASEKSIQDRIQNRAEYEVRKSLPINVSDTEVPNTITSEEFKNLVENKKSEILNSNSDLKNLYEQKQTAPTLQQKTTQQNLMLGPIVFPKYTQEELNFAKGGRVNFASGSDDPESDLYIPPLDKLEETSKEGIYNTKRLGPEDKLSKYKSYSELELLGNIEAKKPNFEILEDSIYYNMPTYEPKDVVPKESRPVMPNRYDERGEDGILSLAVGGRASFQTGGSANFLKMLRNISDSVRELKNSTHMLGYTARSSGITKAAEEALTPYAGGFKGNKHETLIQKIETAKEHLPKEYHGVLDEMKTYADKHAYDAVDDMAKALDKTIDPNLKFENLSKKMFPMEDPLNDAFIIIDPEKGHSVGRYVQRHTVNQETGRGVIQTMDTWDPVNRRFLPEGEQKLIGVKSIEKGKEGLN